MPRVAPTWRCRKPNARAATASFVSFLRSKSNAIPRTALRHDVPRSAVAGAETGRLVLAYQPIVEAADASVESLLMPPPPAAGDRPIVGRGEFVPGRRAPLRPDWRLVDRRLSIWRSLICRAKSPRHSRCRSYFGGDGVRRVIGC